MSTYEHPRRRVAGLTVAFILIGLALLVAALVLISRPGGVPALVVEPDHIDLGSLPLGHRTSFEFQIANAGDGDLSFEKPPYIEVLEGC